MSLSGRSRRSAWRLRVRLEGELVPADGILYALRDHTGTVESIPLIASSVMSKKIAAGADGIILDVKCGRGAFMKTAAEAMDLNRQMVSIGNAAGRRTVAMVTSMEVPLGNAVGNALEVAEAIETLSGRGPQDLHHEVLAIGAQILQMAGMFSQEESARAVLEEKIASGAALEKFKDMIACQGGNPEVVADHRSSRLRSSAGYQSGDWLRPVVDALAIGSIAMDLGAGRQAKGESVSPSAGVVLRAKPLPESMLVETGQALAELHLQAEPEKYARLPDLTVLSERLRDAYVFGNEPPPGHPAVLGIVD